jgi:DNA-binding CsgD family transcriptional regulator/tetratricopeptide (TPR) repeat protein
MAATIVGRSDEVERMASFLAGTQAHGEALFLLGEAGIGKSLLLDSVAEDAVSAGMLVLRASGVEYEAEIGFSGLNQLLLGLWEEIESLALAHRTALRVALGLSDGSPPQRLVVANAVSALLRRVSSHRPVLALVDDVQWTDRPTAEVLGYVARRLHGTRTGLLTAARTGEQSFFERAGLPELELGPLDEQAARTLLASRFPTLAASARTYVISEARGNPLALLELPLVMAASEAGASAAGSEGSQGRRLQRLFTSRIETLTAAARQLLLLMALDGTGDALIMRAECGDHFRLEHLAAAEGARLVRVDDRTRRWVFVHPLVRTAVVDSSTAAERRAAHAQLANFFADRPDIRVWHLTSAILGPDEEVASLLEEAARRSLHRGDAVGAVDRFTRAAELSPAGFDRGRRLADAAYTSSAYLTGDMRAQELLVQARNSDPNVNNSLQVTIAAAHLLLNSGEYDSAHRLLVGAVGHARNLDYISDRLLDELILALGSICYSAGRAELWPAFYDAAAQSPPSSAARASVWLFKAIADPARLSAVDLTTLDHAIATLSDDFDPLRIVNISHAATYVDRIGACQDALWRVVHDQDSGAMAIHALGPLSVEALRTGQWRDAARLSAEYQAASDLAIGKYAGMWVNATVSIAQGDYTRARAGSEDMLQWALPRGCHYVARMAWHLRGLLAMTNGDYEEAFQQLSLISEPGNLPSHVPIALLVIMDLVDCAVRSGHRAEAAGHVDAMREANVAALSSRLALLVNASAAIVTSDGTSLERFDEALALPGIERWPFDLARVQLAHGERLRRAKDPGRARQFLVEALQTFERLEAEPWRARAASELRAAGLIPSDTHQGIASSLTVQELEIATMAAAGMTNKEIGERLFLSHRTVSAHLYRVFPKLGITSRAALRGALMLLNAGAPAVSGPSAK